MKSNDKNAQNIVLASSSPYRREILQKIITNFSTASPDINESAQPDEKPLELSKRLATEKAQALSTSFPQHLIIGSDQVAMVDGTQLHKPGNRENSILQLQRSSGKIIEFYTSLCVLNSKTGLYIVEVDLCQVHMKELSTSEITHYIDREKPFNCAAAFKSEGLGIALFEKITGDDPNSLVGLPLIKLINILEKFNYRIL